MIRKKLKNNPYTQGIGIFLSIERSIMGTFLGGRSDKVGIMMKSR